MDPFAAYDLLVADIQDWDLTGDCVPCELLLIGETAFPVLVNPQGQVLIAASQYGKGRIVVVAHEGYLGNPKMAQFLQNAVTWLSTSPQAVVGVHNNLWALMAILHKSGIRTQPCSAVTSSFAVYCTDAYGDTQMKDLVQFVKRGGGLLIGGQAWYWSYKHSSERVLFDFPGNRVTSVAGVYFTAKYGATGVFNVSGTVPAIPLITSHGLDLRRDLELLLRGVSKLDLVTGGVPSRVLVHGALAFPLGMDGSYQCFLAAAHYGQGRVVVATHESHTYAPQLMPFLLNAIEWLGAGKKGGIGIHPQLKSLHDLLTQQKMAACEIPAPTDNLCIYCCQSYSDREAKKIHEFVAEGGGLLIGGQAWWWASQNRDRNAIADYPGNKILNQFGISILGQHMEAYKYPVLRPSDEPQCYHFRRALSQFQQHFAKREGIQQPLKGWLKRLEQDCMEFLRIPVGDGLGYSSLHPILYKMLYHSGLLPVFKECPVLNSSKKAVPLSQLATKPPDCARVALGDLRTIQRITVEINGTNPGDTAWMSTGLYLPPGSTATLIFPSTMIRCGLKVHIGCHSDDLSRANEFRRAPVVISKHCIEDRKMSVSSIWGGLIYIEVPYGSQLGNMPITIKGAMQAPFFRLGETSKDEWLTSIRHYPAPWGELATKNLILTVPSNSICQIENPEPLLNLWEQIMTAVAELAAVPHRFPRPERIVADVQISAGWMHSGYPIMCHLDSVKELVNMKYMRANGLWGPIHELGHNQQQRGWEFPPHTTEATCNLWSVYVHEKVLGIPRERAHEELKAWRRKERVTGYLEREAPLKDWNVWTALETYLQLQEAFGWEPFIQLFSDYQKMSNIPTDNSSKMNLWAEKFSQQVKKNLVPFFKMWGWPIKDDVSKNLESLPMWTDPLLPAFNKAIKNWR
ncbi:TRPM8 channel-associated factor 2-like [Pelodiscus sinensis]|uniref:TRPM8 channel-associated factor 2-like n=1 Tax=Pelodiscus sinensis TaxID=13735 RepID=UPI003F6B303A